MTSGLAIGVLADGLIAISISYYLLKSRSKVIVSCVHNVDLLGRFTNDPFSTRNIINTLVKYTIQTGVILM